MKRSFFALLACITMCCADGHLYAKSIGIIPQPVSVVMGTAPDFKLSSPLTIGANTNEGKQLAEQLGKKIAAATGFKYQTITNGGDIVLNINSKRNTEIGDEGYTLTVAEKEVTINANTPAGLFYGVQSLIQLMPKEIESATKTTANWRIPTLSITDYPRFAWRGLMLDVSRHFFTVKEVKDYIDNMARYKYNVFHWHLTDDHGWRIQIKALPRLTEVGACRVKRTGKFGNYDWPQVNEKATDCNYYTQEQIKDVIAYAAERHVQVMPEIDVPGHSSAAIAAFPDLSCTKNDRTFVNPGSKISEWYKDGSFKMLVDNSLNPANEGVYRFLDIVYGEVAALFPYPYIHIGGDECYHGYWEKDSSCIRLMQQNGLKNAEELQSYFVKRVEKIITSKGKKLIGWNEILQGGLPPSAAVMCWQDMKQGAEAASQGHYVVMTPSKHTYIDLPQGDIAVEPDVLTWGKVRLKDAYEYEPVPEGVDDKYILGGQANLWSEKVYDMHHGEYMTYPRAWALADIYWSPKDKHNWSEFTGRMERQMSRADIAKINYARSVYDAIIKPAVTDGKLIVTMSTELNGLDIYYSTTEKEEKKKYDRPVVIPDGNVTLSVTTKRGGNVIGKTIKLSREELMKRAKG